MDQILWNISRYYYSQIRAHLNYLPKKCPKMGEIFPFSSILERNPPGRQ